MKNMCVVCESLNVEETETDGQKGTYHFKCNECDVEWDEPIVQ